MGISNVGIVWNRAAMHDEHGELAKGDRALAALLRMHGLIMNGGVFHALEILKENEFDDAVAGYQFFELGLVEDVLARGRELMRENLELDPYEALLDFEYAKIIPDDSSLIAAFERHIAANPGDFAPV